MGEMLPVWQEAGIAVYEHGWISDQFSPIRVGADRVAFCDSTGPCLEG